MCSSTPSFDSSLVLKEPGSSSTSPSRLPRMLVEYHPLQAEQARLEGGSEHGLHQSLAGFEIFAADGQFALVGQFVHRGYVDGQVRRAVGEGHALHERGVGVDHRGGDIFVVLFHPFFERFHALVGGALLDEGLGRGAPDGDQAAGSARLPEVADVLAKLLGEVELVLSLLHVRPVDLLDVVMIEDGLHGLDGAEPAFDFVEQVTLEHAGIAGGGVHVVLENVPAGEHQIIEPGQRNEFLDFGRAAIGAFPQTDGPHLSERADGVRDSFAHRFHARYKRRSHRAHAGDHHAQLALGGLDCSPRGRRCSALCLGI